MAKGSSDDVEESVVKSKSVVLVAVSVAKESSIDVEESVLKSKSVVLVGEAVESVEAGGVQAGPSRT